MVLRFTQQILLLYLLLSAFNTNAQISFTAKIVPAQINKDEYATLRIEIENGSNISNIELPSFKNFNVLSGPSQETGMSNVNGVSKTYMALSYVLQPKKAGSYTLGKASAIISGKKYSSALLKISVKNEEGQSAQQQQHPSMQLPLSISDDLPQPSQKLNPDYFLKPGESIPEKVNKNMHVVLQTNKTSCFVGEPVVATYKLFTRLESQSKMAKAPSFNGFSVVDMLLPDNSESKIEKLNGREYNTYTIRKSQLFPLQSGDFEVEPASIDNEVRFVKAGAPDNYGASDVLVQTVTLSNKPLTVHVKPLPEQGKPASFHGAVGKFLIDTKLERNNFTTDEAGKLIVTIAGMGNLHLLNAPEIKWPQGIDVFEAKMKEEIDPSHVPEAGTKVFEIPFTVSAAGNFEIPAIAFSFFDPATATYKTLHSKPIAFMVVKGTGQSKFDLDTLGRKREISFSEKMFTNRHWIIAVLALLLMMGLVVWQRLDAKNKRKQLILNAKKSIAEAERAKVEKLETIANTPQNPLAKTEACLYSPDCTQFYTLINTEIKSWLASRLLLPVQDITLKKIITGIDKAGVDNVTAIELEKLLQEIEWQLYTPFERTEAMNHLYSRAQAVLQTIRLQIEG